MIRTEKRTKRERREERKANEGEAATPGPPFINFEIAFFPRIADI